MTRLRGSGRLLSLVLVALVVSSVCGPALVLAASGGASAAGGPPAGMVALADGNVDDIRPTAVTKVSAVGEGDVEGAVYVSRHAATTKVDLVTGEQASRVAEGASPADVAHVSSSTEESFALVITDTTNHAGRVVALDVEVIREAMGYTPASITIRNSETGEEWSETATVVDGYLVADVEHFSSNSVSFEGTVNLTADSATNGTTLEYGIDDLDAASDPNVTFTGVTASEWDNVSAPGVANGGTVAVDPAGNLAPTGPSTNDEPTVTFTGREDAGAETSDTATGVSSGGSQTVSIDGNTAPAGPSVNGKPTLAVTGGSVSENQYATAGTQIGKWDPNYSNDALEVRQDGVGGASISGIGITTDCASMCEYDLNMDVYIVEETPDGVKGEGTKVGTVTFTGSNNWKTYQVTMDEYTVSSGASSITVEFVYTSGDGHYYIRADDSPSSTYTRIGGSTYARYSDMPLTLGPGDVTANASDGTSTTFAGVAAGETITNEFALSETSTSIDYTFSAATVDTNLTFQNVTATQDPSIDVDGDGTDEASHTGQLAAGATATYELASLSTADDSATVSTADGSTVDVGVDLRERTQTVDPAVSINGNLLASSGALADGSTTSLTGNESWLVDGTNSVVVEVGDGTLSADAPAPRVELDYSHTARSDQTVEYESEALSVRYTVNKTFASDMTGVNMTIPFKETVYSMRDVEQRTNGGSWTDVGSADYSITDTNSLVIDVGDVTANDTVEVRANGSRVRTVNASITVLEPSTTSTLDSKVRLDSVGTDAYIEVAAADGTDEFVRYTSKESWADADAFVRVFENDAQRLHFPNAAGGDEFRLKSHGTKVHVASNEVDVRFEDSSQEPTLAVSSGPTEGDEVTFEYHNTISGEKYVLWSEDRSTQLDSDVAESPVYLSTSDDSGLLSIFKDDSTTSSDGDRDTSGGTVRSVVSGAKEATSMFPPILLVIAGLGLTTVLYYVDQRTPGERPYFLYVTLPPLWLLVAELVGIPVITVPLTVIAEGLGQVVPLLALGGGGLALYYLYLRFIKGRGTPDKVTNVSFNLQDRGGD